MSQNRLFKHGLKWLSVGVMCVFGWVGYIYSPTPVTPWKTFRAFMNLLNEKDHFDIILFLCVWIWVPRLSCHLPRVSVWAKLLLFPRVCVFSIWLPVSSLPSWVSRPCDCLNLCPISPAFLVNIVTVLPFVLVASSVTLLLYPLGFQWIVWFGFLLFSFKRKTCNTNLLIKFLHLHLDNPLSEHT